MKEKHDQIMEWIDLPLEERPQLIMGTPHHLIDNCVSNSSILIAYEPSLDQAGHFAGPNSELVNVCELWVKLM